MISHAPYCQIDWWAFLTPWTQILSSGLLTEGALAATGAASYTASCTVSLRQASEGPVSDVAFMNEDGVFMTSFA